MGISTSKNAQPSSSPFNLLSNPLKSFTKSTAPEDDKNLVYTPLTQIYSPDPLQNTAIPRGKKKAVIFNWTHGGKEVFLSGTFDNWSTKIPMKESRGDFSCIQTLAPGLHYYRFIVDDKWQTDPGQPMVEDRKSGESANYVEVYDEPSTILEAELETSPSGIYGQDDTNYNLTGKSPPSLPPHFLKSLLNAKSLSQDPSELPLPHHVMLHHLYTEQRPEDNLLVFGITQRYTFTEKENQKFVTTVFYQAKDSEMAPPGPVQTNSGFTTSAVSAPLQND